MDQLDHLNARLAAAVAKLESVANQPDPRLAELEVQLAEAKAQEETRVEAQASAVAEAAANAQGEVQGELAAVRAGLEAMRDERDAALADLDALRVEFAAAQQEVDLLRAEVAKQTDAAMSSAEQRDAIDRLDRSVQQVQHVNDVLRSNNADLRAASGAAAPEQVAAGMQAEIDGLKAAREADAATAGAILSRLSPLLSHATDLPDGEEE